MLDWFTAQPREVQQALMTIIGGFLIALITSAATLLGISLTIRANHNKLRTELAADAVKAKSEREFASKRDVYLAAADGLARQMKYVVSIANPKMSQEDLDELLSDVSGAINKVHVVAGMDTVRRLLVCQSTFGDIVIDLVTRKIPVQKCESELAGHQSWIDVFTKGRDRCASQFERISSGELKLDERGHAVLHEKFDKLQSDLNKRYDDQKTVKRELDRLRVELWGHASLRALEFGETLTEVNLEIRKELGLDIDEAGYRQVMAEAFGQGKQRMAGFFETIRKIIK